MKLKFTKLVTPSETIQISFDGGNTYTTYNVAGCKSDGVSFTETDCPDLTKIVIKGKFKSFSDSIDVVRSISASSSNEYPTVHLLSTLGYSGNAQFTVVNTDDESIARLITAFKDTSESQYTYFETSNGTTIAAGNITTALSLKSNGNIYFKSPITNENFLVAKYICDNADKIPVTYFNISGGSCSSYCLNKDVSHRVHIYDVLSTSSDNIYLPFGKYEDISSKCSRVLADTTYGVKIINNIVYINLSNISSTSNFSSLGFTGASAAQLLLNLDGVSFYVADSNGNLTESKYYLDLGLMGSAISGFSVVDSGCNTYALYHNNVDTLMDQLGFRNSGANGTNLYVTTIVDGIEPTTIGSINYYQLTSIGGITDASIIRNLEGSEIYLYVSNNMIDTGCTIGTIE